MTQRQIATDVHTVKLGAHLNDAAQDRETTAEALVEVVRDMTLRLTPGSGYDDAVVAFADGLRAIADDLDPDPDPGDN